MDETVGLNPVRHHELLDEPGGPAHTFLSQVALYGVGLSAEHFYGGRDHFVGRVLGGDGHRLFVVDTPGAGPSGNEAVGSGADVDSALRDTLSKMRTLETVRTRSLVHMEMTDAAFVSFTPLEHYSPKVAPSRDTYPIPSYLEDTLRDDFAPEQTYSQTYRNTTEKDGWQQGLRTMVEDYIASEPDGQRLMDGLKIRSLSHLTPEQAVKLSAAFVQNVSKYSSADVRSKAPTRADQSTAQELLREGMTRRGDPAWEGNGVCRNIASNVKAVFEALKSTQSELSMLNNTYSVYGVGKDGAGYADTREDTNTTSFADSSGHAWNTFVTIDANGSAAATILDATWALGEDASEAIEHLDRTEIRAVAQIMRLFEKSEVKAKAFYGLSDYAQRVIRTSGTNPQLAASQRQSFREYVTTEYLKAIAGLPEVPECSMMDPIMASAYQLRGKLDGREVATLFALNKAGGGLDTERLKLIIAGYDKQRQVPLPELISAENLVFGDDELQRLAYEAVGAARVQQLAESSGRFRVRLREMDPGVLPPFDAAVRRADAQELSYLAKRHGIHERDPRDIMRRLTSQLRGRVGDDAAYDALVAGRTDYELVRDFGSIWATVRENAKS